MCPICLSIAAAGVGMLNYVGSLRYDQHGRKRKTKALKKARSSSQVRTHGFHPCNLGSNPGRATNKNFKSMPIGSYDAKKALEEMKMKIVRQQESKNYTVAPAYNKGAYQVIPKDCVKDIGR
jgi:hypothetical protein